MTMREWYRRRFGAAAKDDELLAKRPLLNIPAAAAGDGEVSSASSGAAVFGSSERR